MWFLSSMSEMDVEANVMWQVWLHISWRYWLVDLMIDIMINRSSKADKMRWSY